MKATVLNLAVLAGLLATASPLALANPPQTGIHGQSYRYISYGMPYLISPDIWIGIPSVQLPVATSFTLLSAHNGREVARVRTNDEGFYTVSVPPGKICAGAGPISSKCILQLHRVDRSN